MSASVRLTFRLGQSGDQIIEAITERGCAVQVEAKAGDDDMVVVEVRISDGGRKPVHREGEGNQAVPQAVENLTGVRDRHVVRIGNGGFGCVRVLGHEVSPYNWQLVNHGVTMQHGADLSQLYRGGTLTFFDPTVESDGSAA